MASQDPMFNVFFFFLMFLERKTSWVTWKCGVKMVFICFDQDGVYQDVFFFDIVFVSRLCMLLFGFIWCLFICCLWLT